MRYFILILCLVLGPTTVWANPSDKQPHAPLDLHGQEIGPELFAAAQQLSEKNRTTLAKIEGLYTANKVDKIDIKDVGNTYLQTIQLRRLGTYLQALGEPAGYDFAMRADQQVSNLGKIINAMKSLPNATNGINNLRTRAGQISQQRAKQIPKLQKLIQQEKWLEAEKELNEILDELEPYLVFLQPEDRSGITAPFNEVASMITPGAYRARRAKAQELLLARRKALDVDWQKLLTQIEAASKDVALSGKHAIDGKDLTGPELIAYFDTAWQKAHLAAIKALAIEWARSLVVDQSPTPEQNELQAAYAKFTAAAGPALAGIIAADTSRIDPSATAKVYAAYLPPVADLCDHAAGSGVEPALTKALDDLARKSPEFAAKVATYRTMTDETLRWRKRVAADQAKARARGHETLLARATEAFQRDANQPGLWTPEAPTTTKARLNSPAGSVMGVAGPKVIGQPAIVADIAPLAAGGAGIGRYQQRVYSRVKLPQEQLAAAVSALQTALQASDTQPPLSLAATRALRSAQRGDFLQAGGPIGAVYLEGHVARFAALPDAAGVLLPLGKLPESYPDRDQLEQVVLRFDVQPAWWQHEYFLIDVPN